MKRIITLFIFMLSIQSIFSQAPTNGLVAYYPFNGNAQDESGNGNHGTVNGATLTTDRFGNSGRAFSFDGVSNNILVNNSNSLQNINEITLSAWVYYTGLASDGTIPILDKSNSSIGGQYFLRIYNNGNNSFSGTLNGNHGGLSFNGIQPQTWHLLTMVSANNNFKFYLDGQLIGAVNGSGTSFSNTLPLTIGANPSGILEVLNGKLDDIRIYNRALSDAEVSQIYYSEYNPTPPTEGLVAYYPFNNNANDEHLTQDPNSPITTTFNGTVYGATPTTDRFGNCNSAYSFNGTSDYIQLNSNIGIVNELTVSAWVKTEQPSTNINAIVSTNNDTGFHFQISDNPSVNIVSYNNSNNFNVTLPIIPITPSQVWRHLIVVYKSGQSKIYENGIQIGFSNDLFSSIEILNNLFIGSGYLNQRFFNGKLDDIRIYNQALNQQQVTDLYNAEKPSNAGTNNEAGITVLVHGFQLSGGGGVGGTLSPTEDFEKMGANIISRAGGGVMYKNNPTTGQLEQVPNTGSFPYPLDQNKEIVLVYNWGDLSNNGVTSTNFGGNGYLESASDNLFATILKLANPTNLPMSFSLQQFLNKPKHFIGHSRGTILLLQTLHRFGNFFPNTEIEQVTFLDPHPATVFGDMVSTYDNAPSNLPGIYGVCTDCYTNQSFTLNYGCNLTTADIKLPFNVKKVDNYYRKDSAFEGLGEFGQFDGLPLFGNSLFNRELDNNVLNIGSPTLGGTHSAVHYWYRGTINLTENVADTSTNTQTWYSPLMTMTNINNNFMLNECRSSTGFAYSRIGGRYNDLPLINPNHKLTLTQLNQALAEREGLSASNPNGIAPRSVFNGDFHYKNDAGWTKNGASNTEPYIINETAGINYNIGTSGLVRSSLKHSLMYFGGIAEDFKYLKLDAKISTISPIGKGIIKFYDDLGNEISSSTFDLSILNNSNWKTLYFPLPNELKAGNTSDGKVGTFGIFGLDNNASIFFVDNIELLQCTPIANDLYVAMPDPSTLNFADIDNDHWAKEGIYKSRNYGLFRGTSNTTFTPNTSLTKAEAITVLVRAGIKLGVIPTYNTTGLPYADVTSCNQYFPYIQTAKNLGHLEFTSNFNPNSPITVAQLCVYMDKILQINLHDWNAITYSPWVLAPNSQYILSQLSQIVINQPGPEQNAAMRRILNCIDVVKNDNAIESYRTQNVWTLKDVENINISSGQTVEVDGTATVTRARMAVASANLFRFVYKKLNNGNAPAGRMANTMNTTNSDPSIDDFIGIGNTFDNKDIPATDTPEVPTQITFNIYSGDTLGLQYQSDTDTAGNPQFFYWSMNKNVDSNIANLVSVPINSIQNHRKVNFVAPVVTSPKTWYLYSYLANNKGKIKETVITINVSSTLSTNNVNGILDNVKIYPNPTDNILFIDTLDKGIQKIELFDLQGRLLKTIKENKEKYQIDISNFSSATYLVKLSTEKGSQTVKIVKK